jgi:hypothetical protein
MSDDNKTVTGVIPPRLTIVKLGQNDEAPKPAGAVVPLVPPVPAASSPEQNSGDGIPANKKKTARISLDQVSAEPGAAVAVPGVGLASKTIRLGPAMSGQVSIAPLPAVGKALTGVLIPEETKRKTSRISLDSVLPQLETAPAGGDTTPKTIRIKRPTIAPPAASNVTPPQPIEPVVLAPTVEGVKTRTAPIEAPQEEVVPEGQQTQKKTLKIRRADGGAPEIKAAPREVGIARNEPEVGVTPSVPVASAAPHWSFVLVAAAAVIAMCVMLYVLVAQAYPSLGISL